MSVGHIDTPVKEVGGKQQKLPDVKIHILFQLIAELAVPCVKFVVDFLYAVIDLGKARGIRQLQDGKLRSQIWLGKLPAESIQ